MKFRRFGRTGLQISSVCLGTMTFGDGADPEACKDIYRVARDSGINLFDCADVYGDGESERILGSLTSAHRSQIILTSKSYFPSSDDPNDQGLNRRHLTQSLENSLQRLQTDYLDVFFLHAFDDGTPLEETIGVLSDFVQSGKVLYVGASNFAAWQVMKAIQFARTTPLGSLHCIQPMYNLLKRQAESELLPMAESEDLGVIAYGPLAGGLLTGKYLPSLVQQQGRFIESKMYRNRYRHQNTPEIVEAYLHIAQKWKMDPIALAIAWVGSNTAVTAPLLGVRSLAQLETALLSVDMDLDEEILIDLEKIVPPPPLATDREDDRPTYRSS